MPVAQVALEINCDFTYNLEMFCPQYLGYWRSFHIQYISNSNRNFRMFKHLHALVGPTYITVVVNNLISNRKRD